MYRKGQVVVEFLIFVGMAFAVVFTLLISVLSVSETNKDVQIQQEMDDLGNSLQQEFLLATQLEDGYIRRLDTPITLSGKDYDLYVGQTNLDNSYLVISYDVIEIYYMIPPVSGNMTPGHNVLMKVNGTLILTQ